MKLNQHRNLNIQYLCTLRYAAAHACVKESNIVDTKKKLYSCLLVMCNNIDSVIIVSQRTIIMIWYGWQLS